MLLLRPLDNGWCPCPGRAMHEPQLQQKHRAVSVCGEGGCQPAEQPRSPRWVCGNRKSLSLIPLREGRACWGHPKGGTRVLRVLSGQSQHGAHCCSQIRCRYVGSSVGGSELSSRQQYRFALGEIV